MNLTDAVRHAATPREAIILLAEAIDELRAAKPIDPWESWGDEPGRVYTIPINTVAPTSYPTPAEADKQVLEHLREQLAATADGEDRLALEARIRLLEEDGQPT